ncbi:MAG TPA: DUF4386 family protein [Gemmatimonadaceae bacterium]|nr:DUF4386 family protein [Gemmatimonadaceae bacterium]
MRKLTSVWFGGFFLIAGALAFMGVFAFLAAQFDYPRVLDGNAADVLPALLATGTTGRVVWAIYGFLPLIWIPAGVGAFQALRTANEGGMRVALLFAQLACISMMLGLLRWPSIHWSLAQAYASGTETDKAAIAAVFTGLNSFLGNYIGEFLGELSFSIFFLLSALAMLVRGAGFPRWSAYFGILVAAAGMVGMFRNVTTFVSPVAAANNYLLPLWMIIFGIVLLRFRTPAIHAS